MRAFCTACGARLEADARFCSACGKAVGAGEGVRDEGLERERSEGRESGAPDGAPDRRGFTIGCLTLSTLPVLAAGIILAVVIGRGGCSSVEGRVEAHGKPLGDYVVTPTLCQSGQHQSFFGVTLFPDEDAPGTLVVVDDPVRGRMVRALVDGSCHADSGNTFVCSYAAVNPAQCARFEMSIVPTSTTVNDIRLVDGRLLLDCTMAEGGTLAADLVFESCD